MIKINYPSDTTSLDQDYITALNTPEIQTRLSAFFSNPKFTGLTGIKTVDQLLVMKFDELVTESFRLKKLITDKNDILEVQKIFNYSKSESGYLKQRGTAIANFFMKNHSIIDLNACYYCNADYIFAFKNIGDFEDEIHFLNTAEDYELSRISGFGETTITKIIKARAKKNILTINETRLKLTTTQKSNLLNFKVKELKSHFTLDHVLNKADHPFMALSLYNFVPCCFACNSKFKGDKPLINNENDNALSPTSNTNDLEANLKFKLYFSNNLDYQQNKASINNTDDFTLELSSDLDKAGHKRFLKIFKLKERYVFHKKTVLDLIVKEKSYSDSRIREIANMMNMNELQIKSDLFGEEVVTKNNQSKPLAKLKIDIANNIGL